MVRQKIPIPRRDASRPRIPRPNTPRHAFPPPRKVLLKFRSEHGADPSCPPWFGERVTEDPFPQRVNDIRVPVQQGPIDKPDSEWEIGVRRTKGGSECFEVRHADEWGGDGGAGRVVREEAADDGSEWNGWAFCWLAEEFYVLVVAVDIGRRRG
jgi:hypothetical protein